MTWCQPGMPHVHELATDPYQNCLQPMPTCWLFGDLPQHSKSAMYCEHLFCWPWFAASEVLIETEALIEPHLEPHTFILFSEISNTKRHSIHFYSVLYHYCCYWIQHNLIAITCITCQSHHFSEVLMHGMACTYSNGTCVTALCLCWSSLLLNLSATNTVLALLWLIYRIVVCLSVD